MIIGGMPKVISTFIQTNSFKLAEKEKMDILKLYQDDLRKHDELHGTICCEIFDSIPSQLAKANSKRFKINSIKNKKRYEQIKRSLLDLSDFKIINKINSITSLESPIALKKEEDKFKLYFCDTGLLFSKLINISNKNINEVYFKFIIGKNIINLGPIFESISIQQLVLKGYQLYYHKYNIDQKDTIKKYELDLVTEIDFKVNAIEIKSSKNYLTSSLDNIKTKYPQLKINRYVYGIKNLLFESNKTTIPIYMLLFI